MRELLTQAVLSPNGVAAGRMENEKHGLAGIFRLRSKQPGRQMNTGGGGNVERLDCDSTFRRCLSQRCRGGLRPGALQAEQLGNGGRRNRGRGPFPGQTERRLSTERADHVSGFRHPQIRVRLRRNRRLLAKRLAGSFEVAQEPTVHLETAVISQPMRQRRVGPTQKLRHPHEAIDAS